MSSSSSSRGFRFAIDRGGTFTDVYAELPNGEHTVMKLLSVDSGYDDAPTEAIRRILEKVRIREEREAQTVCVCVCAQQIAAVVCTCLIWLCGGGITKRSHPLCQPLPCPQQQLKQQQHTGQPHPKDQPIDTSRIESIRMATTVATNALLERKGEPIALVITKVPPFSRRNKKKKKTNNSKAHRQTDR